MTATNVGRSRPTARKRVKRFMNAIVMGASVKAGTGAGARRASATRTRRPAILPAWQPLGVRAWAYLRAPRAYSVVLLLVCLLTFAYTVNDARFYIVKPEITGRQTIPLKEVYVLSGVPGLHLFWVNPEAVAATLAASPSVLAAEVTVAWPNSVKIALVERAPVAVWQQAGAVNWVAADGRLMPARGTLTHALVIAVDGKRPLSEGTQAVEAQVVQAALALRELRPNIERLNYFERGGLEYNDGRGWQAFFGMGENMPQKLAVYERLIDYLLKERGIAAESLEYVVVTDVKHPFYKLRGE